MPALSFVSFVIFIFIAFAVRYFIKNNIANSQQRKSTAIAALKLLYYLPVFLQGLFLIWVGITHFFFNCRPFYSLLSSMFFKDTGVAGWNFDSLAFLLTSSVLLGLNGWFAKISCTPYQSIPRVISIIFYLGFSTGMLFLLYKNLMLTLSFGIGLTNIFFYTQPFVVVGTLLTVTLLIISMYKESMNKIIWLRYLQLPVKVILLYCGVCFSIGLAIFILHFLFWLLS